MMQTRLEYLIPVLLGLLFAPAVHCNAGPCFTDNPQPCPDEDCGSSSCLGGGDSQSPASSKNPVLLRQGSVIESAVDLSIGGSVLQFEQSRSYRTLTNSYSVGDTTLGNRWYDVASDIRLLQSFPIKGDDGHGTPDLMLRMSALESVMLTWDSGNSEYTSPADFDLWVTKNTTDSEIVVVDRSNQQVYVFYDFSGSNKGLLKLKTISQAYFPASEADEHQIDIGTTYTMCKELIGKTWRWYVCGASIENFGGGSSDGANMDTPTIEYEYDEIANVKLLQAVTIWSDGIDTSDVLQKVEYTYQDEVTTPDGDIGESGDLVQVKVTKRDSTGTPGSEIVRYTQYRYYSYTTAGHYGILKAVYEHDAVMQMVEDSVAGTKADDLLKLADDDDVKVGGYEVHEYSSRAFEYHFSPSDPDGITSDVDTIWEDGEDLEDQYVGTNGTDWDEEHELRVKREHIGGVASCSSCSGVADGRVSKHYYYVGMGDQGFEPTFDLYSVWKGLSHANHINEVTLLVIEDTVVYDDVNPDGKGKYRKIYGLNDYGRILREVLIENPTATPLKCWCEASIYTEYDLNDDDGDAGPDGNVLTDLGGIDTGDKPNLKHRLAEFRPASAYNITTEANLKKFFDPYDDDDANMPLAPYVGKDFGGDTLWGNDITPASDAEITLYEYNDDGRLTGIRVKKGSDDAYYVSATDWGTDAAGGHIDDQPTDRKIATYIYPTQTTTRTDSSRITTSYAYDFWDTKDKYLKKQVTTYPSIATGQNGSGVPSTMEEYYDLFGRLRWEKDAEEVVTYTAYAPGLGGVAYVAVDVDPSNAGDDIEKGDNHGTEETDVDLKWSDWTAGEADQNKPARGTSLPAVLAIVTKQEYDSNGRLSLRIDPPSDTNSNGAKHYIVYGADRNLQISYWDGSAGEAEAPIQVTEFDDQDRVSSRYTLAPDYTITTTGSSPDKVPTKLTSTPTTSNYLSFTNLGYNDDTGQLDTMQQYHNAGGTAEFTDYTKTTYLYDLEGRRSATIVGVASGTFQVDVTVRDVLGREIERRRGVDSTFPTEDYDDLSGGSAPSWLETISTTEYDDGDPGVGYVTSTKTYHTDTKYTQADYKRNYRGLLRGIDRKADGSTSFGPYTVYDVDWQGRTTASAQYTSTPTWPTDYADHVIYSTGASAGQPNKSGHNNVSISNFDDRGRVYQTLRYPGTEGTDHFVTNYYYDRNGQLVATGDMYSAHTEYAYDAAGRQYQVRTVEDVESTSHDGTSGAFNYRAPVPHPTLTSMSTTVGDDKLVSFTHTKLDKAGNALEEHSYEVNHDDANGLKLTTYGKPTDGVRTTTHNYYDEADRIITTAFYGSGEENAGAVTWKAADVPDYDAGTSTGFTSTANRLITQYEHYFGDDPNTTPTETGRNESVTDPAGVKTKTYYDHRNRRTVVAENHDNFLPPLADIGGGTDDEDDRVTSWVYNGLGQITKLTAHNEPEIAAKKKQETDYFYEYPVNAALVIHTIYPDATTRTAQTTFTTTADQVRVEYHLDGSIKRKKDQRDVVIEYTYNNARQITLQAATNIPAAVDDYVQSIGRTYDTLGRVTRITSYAGTTTATTIRNEIELTYGTHGMVTKSEQSHDGTTVGVTKPDVDYVYETSADPSDIYADNLRLQSTTYPNGRAIFRYVGTSGGINDRLGRVYQLRETNGAGTLMSEYHYNGTNRVAKVLFDDASVHREMFSAVGDYDSWDRFGRTLTQRWETTSSAVRDEVAYTYDSAGNRETRNVTATSNDKYDYKYTYDGLHRLKTQDQGTWNGNAIISSQEQRYWQLDQLGNWEKLREGLTSSDTLREERTHTMANEIDVFDTPGTTIDPDHDDAGNMTEGPSPGDPTVKHKYIYDAWNRLAEVTDSAGTTTIQENQYDGLNRRLVRDETSARHFYYNRQWQVLEEREGTASNADMQYVYHPHYVDAVAFRYWDENDSKNDVLETVHYYLQDANFNVTAVTDSTGAVDERYTYTPYGEATVLNPDFSLDSSGDDGKSDIDNEHLYTGRRLDPETGLQLNRSRFYHAPLGRWVNRDPIGYLAGSWNLYEYVKGRPTYFFDPFGLTGVDAAGAACCPDEMVTIEIRVDPPDDSIPDQVYEEIDDKCGKLTGLAYVSCVARVLSRMSDGTDVVTGHAWLYCEDNGKGWPKEIGFYPSGFKSDHDEKCERTREIKVCPETNDCIQDRIISDIKNPPRYSVPGTQCSSWPCSVLNDCGIDLGIGGPNTNPFDLGNSPGFGDPGPNPPKGTPWRGP